MLKKTPVRIAFAFAIGLFAGVLAGWMVEQFTTNGASPDVPGESTSLDERTPTNGTAATTTPQSDDLGAVINNGAPAAEAETVNARVVVSDQEPGGSVSVTSALLPEDGWIVVHEERDGRIANALGAVRRDAGAHADLSVPLLRNTQSEVRYWVVLYQDNGDREFSLEDDFPIRTPDDTPVAAGFTATP